MSFSKEPRALSNCILSAQLAQALSCWPRLPDVRARLVLMEAKTSSTKSRNTQPKCCMFSASETPQRGHLP